MQQLQETNRIVIATVIAVIPEFNQAICQDDTGHRYAITQRNIGLQHSDVKKDDRVKLEVTTLAITRVTHAELC